MKEYGWQGVADTVDALLKAKLGDRFRPGLYTGMGGPAALSWGYDFPPDQDTDPEVLTEKIAPDFDDYSMVNYEAVEAAPCRLTGYIEILFREVLVYKR